MALLRRVARPLLASTFIHSGLYTYRHPGAIAPAAEPVVNAMAEYVPSMPKDAEQAVRVNGAIHIAAGTMLALGRMPRLAALVLAASLVPTTIAGHAFWKAEDPQERAQQKVHFYKNLSMFGGLLIVAADTHGHPSLAWRSRRAVASARREAKSMRRTARTAATSGSAARAVKGLVPSR
ncbi:DoxX family protein [Streptomyces capparidis]